MKIVAVDDKKLARDTLEQAIRKAAPFAELAVCRDAEEVLALPDLSSLDVAFVDVRLPRMSGVALARELKRLNPRINIVFATGYDEYMPDAFALRSSGYIVKPVTDADVAAELDGLRYPPAPSRYGLFFRCFGNFEAFVEGKALHFERTRTKELLAFLVDRRGAIVTLREAQAVIFADSCPNDKTASSYMRTLAGDLKKTFRTYHHEDALVRSYGKIGLDTRRASCDYWDFLQDDPMAIRDWRGEYMDQYSWAEETKATLLM